MGREQSLRLDITVSSGTGTGTITSTWDICRRLRIIPPSETDTYNVNIKDGEGHLIFARTSQLGTLSELQELSLGICRTVNISSSSSEGNFSVKFDMH